MRPLLCCSILRKRIPKSRISGIFADGAESHGPFVALREDTKMRFLIVLFSIFLLVCGCEDDPSLEPGEFTETSGATVNSASTAFDDSAPTSAGVEGEAGDAYSRGTK